MNVRAEQKIKCTNPNVCPEKTSDGYYDPYYLVRSQYNYRNNCCYQDKRGSRRRQSYKTVLTKC